MIRLGILRKTILSSLLIVFFATCNVFASEEESGHKGSKGHKSFNPGEFIFDHIGDSYEWNIIEIQGKIISIPLPIILYSKQQGFVSFMSSKLKHGRESYKNFRLVREGENKGKIAEILPDGSEKLPFDISITKNIAALLFSVFVILFVFISVGNSYKRRGNHAPKGLQSWVEPIILFVRDDIAKPSIGEKKYEKFMPYLLTVFFFIWINNMLGLIPIAPGGANVTGNIAVTMILALITFIITTINGNKIYWGHIINMPGVPFWLKLPPLPIMPLVELIGIFTKPLVLMIRLFANITAGHIIALGFLSLIFLFGEMNQYVGYGFSLVSVGFIIFMTFLELLVAFIQAYVFTFLSALYFGMATEEHH